MPKSFMELANEARARIREIDVAGTARAIASKETVVVDVRDPAEYRQGHLPGAVNIPWGAAGMGVPQAVPDRTARIIVYCAAGNRSALVADDLKQMGYESIESLAGGIQGWLRSGQPVVR